MSLHRRPPARRRRRQRGQGLTEFALVIPIFLLLVVALFDLGRAVFAYNTLTNAAREGARIAIVNQYTPTIVSRAKSQTNIVELDDPSVSVSFWNVRTDGKPDISKGQCNSPRRGRLPRHRQVRGDLPSDHAVHQQHPVRERSDVHRHVTALGRIQLSTKPQLWHGRGRRSSLSEAAMNAPSTTDSTHEVTMQPTSNRADRRAQRGQIIVVAALTMIALIGGVSLILEGGNAYAHQRMAQNAADSVANAGATILAQRLGGGTGGRCRSPRRHRCDGHRPTTSTPTRPTTRI